jgi:hypothetical protein
MNEITTTTSVLSLDQCDALLTTGMCSIRDAILGYTQHGLTQPQISERVKALGFKASVPTIQRHVADLRKEGLLPAVEASQKPEAVRQRRHRESVTRHQNDAMSRPPVQPVSQDTTVLPLIPDNVSVEPEPEPVLVPAVVVELDEFRVSRTDEDDAERDYDECLKHIDAIITLTKKYFHNGWSKGKWNELAGECRTIEACCNAHCGSQYGKGVQ